MKKAKDISKIRKETCIISTALLDVCDNDASLAFKKAWYIVKARKIYSKVAGISYNNRKAVLYEVANALHKNKEIKTTLEREKNNEYDENAVKINVTINGETKNIGYLSTKMAKIIAPLLDKGIDIKLHIIDTDWTARFVLWLN